MTGEKNPSVPTALLGDTQVTSYWTAMTDLTMAYYYTENTTYATRAAYLTRQFFVNTTTKMNPNMNFGQMWPGVCVFAGLAWFVGVWGVPRQVNTWHAYLPYM